MESESITATPEIPVKNFRFYGSKLPHVNDVVMVQIYEINDYCGVVHLLEYADDNSNLLTATIQFSELSSTRLKQSPASILKIGRVEPMQVLRVDEEKSYIDLTRKHLNNNEKEACKARYTKSKLLHSILNYVAYQLPEVTLADLYENLVWQLPKEVHPLDTLQGALLDSTILEIEDIQLSAATKELLLQDLKQKVGAQPVKVAAEIEISCFARDGIEGIIPSLQAGKNAAENFFKQNHVKEKSNTKKTVEDSVKITVVSAPKYTIQVVSKDKDVALKSVEEALQAIQNEIKKYHGFFAVTIQPVVSAV